MTKLFILGGNSKRNKNWVVEANNYFINKFDVTEIFYDSWEKENELVDLNHESKKLADFAQNEKDFLILAKSAGTAISIQTIVENNLKPKFCLFLGFPKNWLEERGFKYLDYLEKFQIKTILIQNTEDPYYSYSEAKELFSKFSNIEVRSFDAQSHDYNEFQTYLEIFHQNQ